MASSVGDRPRSVTRHHLRRVTAANRSTAARRRAVPATIGLFLQRYCYISSASPPSLASTRMQQTVAVEQTPRETSPRNRRQPPTSRPPPIRRSTEVDDRTGVSFTIFRVKIHTERQRSAEHRSNTLTRISRSGISSNVTRERADTKTTTATQVTRTRR